MRGMDRQYMETPFYGSRRMKAWLDRHGCQRRGRNDPVSPMVI